MINIICGTILLLKGKIEEGTFAFMIGFGSVEFLLEAALIHDLFI